MGLDKAELRKKFTKDWEKHYKVQFLLDKGFKRKQCKSCGSWFWTLDSKRELCGDTKCEGYQFIGKGTKHYSYVETWREIEKYFVKKGHTSINRYPVVCRWRDDLYFTNASIIDFQPYVVTGEVEPPANPLIVPQTSLRFKDVSNVGVTGAHYTCFVMFGQHAFNTHKTKQFYWKDEALEHDYNYLTQVIGVNKEDLVFKEDVWAGGGTFGPCIEYFAKGVELGNCVFMQFQELENGNFKELSNKIVDMGAGLERLAWFTNGTATSYDVTYGNVIKKMFKNADLKIDNKLFLEYSKLAGKLNIDEIKNLHSEKEKIAKQLGISYNELYKNVERIQALYAVADHLKTILYTTTDGMLPSNSGGGYNLRMLLRRVFAFDSDLKLNLDYAGIIRGHAELLEELDDTVLEGVPIAIDLIHEERKRFSAMKETASKKISAFVESAKKGKEISQKELVRLYESEGIPPETVQEMAGKQNVKVEIPDNFYGLLAKKDEREKEKISYGLGKYPNTKMLFYEDPYMLEFTATVLGVDGDTVVLDKTLFYPESGGQAADFGSIDGVQVYRVQKEGGVVLHFMKNVEKFRKGKKVSGEIDGKRRLALMRHHTATHLLNASARELLGNHIWQAGAEKQADKAHLDLTHYRRITDEELKKIEILVNEKIQMNVPVETEFLQRNKAEEKYGFRIYQGGFVPGKELRIVKVKGIDVQACGGTHATKTGDIGFFKIIKREGIKDGIERITFAAGIPALEYVQKKEEMIKNSAEIMNVPEQMLAEGTARFFREWKEQRKKIEELQKRLGCKELENIVAGHDGRIYKMLPATDQREMLQIAQQIVEKNKKSVAILCDSTGNLLVLRGSESREKASEILAEIKTKCGGVGGGDEKIARGRIKETEKFKKLA